MEGIQVPCSVIRHSHIDAQNSSSRVLAQLLGSALIPDKLLVIGTDCLALGLTARLQKQIDDDDNDEEDISDDDNVWYDTHPDDDNDV